MATRDQRTLEQFLRDELPEGWIEAARSGDEARLDRLKDSLDNPGFVRRLGAAGWVAPHWAPEHGGRGLSIDDAQGALEVLDSLEVPRVPRGSGLVLAAPTILQWSSEETKCRLLPSIATGEERWCQLQAELEEAV